MEKYRFTEQRLAIYEEMKQPFGIYQYVNNRVEPLVLSDGFCKLFGYETKDQAYADMRRDLYTDAHPDDVTRLTDAAMRFAVNDERYEVIYRTRIKSRPGYKIVHAIGTHVYEEDGTRLAHVWYMDEGNYEEVPQYQESELKRAMNSALHEESIVKSVSYDYLTGLPSMTYFFELADSRKENIRKNGGHPMLLYIDFSGMKFFNVNNGFEQGDKILRAFAKLLAKAFGGENSCRISGDHFAVIAQKEGLEEKLKNLFHEFGTVYGGKTPPVHAGIYSYEIEDITASAACDRAKLASNSLKGSYNSGFCYYKDELRQESLQRQYIIENIDTAIREKWIQVYLQPIVRIVTEKVCDVEALARWIDPEKGFLSPASFIPALEDSGLIYKLDLYMVDQVLEVIRKQKEEGMYVLPHSINLSRVDFSACDIVEEITRRVDAAGVSREKITIEITESVVGSDFEFMKEQVERFRKLGFPVWLDDFGSGYSSLDFLQSIRFDLIKFDMSFMKKLDTNEDSRIILTELMRMATSLGVDTVCEGVETEAQKRFLQEIGCSKIQGYFYSKPISFEEILKMHHTKGLLENENPEESEYYETIGKVNLYDLSVIAQGEESNIRNTFDVLPMGVIEVKGECTRFARSNQSYRDFIKRFFGLELSYLGTDFVPYDEAFMNNVVKTCCELGLRSFYDEKMQDGSIVHSFSRRIAINPVTGSVAVATAVLSVSDPEEGTTYAEIARALAADYYTIYVVDMDTDNYVEYSSLVGGEQLALEKHGTDFFSIAKRDSEKRIYENDREMFQERFSKEKVIYELDTQGVFTITYRLMEKGEPMYVNMKITRMQGGNRIILGISIIDAQMKSLEEEKRLRQEKVALARVASLAGSYIALYMIDPETEQFIVYNAASEYSRLGFTQQGNDFFKLAREEAKDAICPEDLERYLLVFNKEHILQEIRQKGLFSFNYRLLIDGKYVPFSVRATLVEEEDGDKIILGVNKLFVHETGINESEVIYTHIAHALARGYTDLYYINIDTDEFIEYHTDDNLGVLTEARRGADFFEGCRRDVKLFVHKDDQEKFVHAMDPVFLKQVLAQSKVFEMTYRRIKDGRTFYVKMKVSRMEDDKRLVVLAVSDIDELMKKRFMEERIQEERLIYARLHALTGNFIVVYIVDPATDQYREFSATDDYTEGFAQATEGEDFFNVVRKAAQIFNHPSDMERFLKAFTKDNVLDEVRNKGIFTFGYRLMMEGKPVYVQMKAAMVEEKEGPRLIVGLNNIDSQVRQEKEFGRRLELAQTQAKRDDLTGVKNKHAYLEVEAVMDHQIEDNCQPPFCIAMLDVNDLKKVNDTKGHQAGDEHLRGACKIICDVFKHSPVFRVGGDEFAVIAQGEDYENIDELIGKINAHNAVAIQNGGIVVACGKASFDNDSCVATVFERADHDMYENKNYLKSLKNR